MSASKTNLIYRLTAQAPGAQTDSSFSTGGYVTSTPMPLNFFNNSFNASLKQYRCIAIQNIGATDVFKNLTFFFKSPSQNPAVSFRMAIEIPTTEVVNSTASVAAGFIGNSISVVGTGLANAYPDNYFDGCVFNFTSGANINFSTVVSSYDGPSGTFTFVTASPMSVANGDGFTVLPSPSQIAKSGTIEPTVGTTHVTPFATATGLSNAVGINVSGTRLNGPNLAKNEVVYLWIEKSTSPNAAPFDDNTVTFTANYQTN